MGATSECAEKGKPRNKVSKPLMEKKRRARINQCLDELKSILESCYCSSIRKRKLEKADILELTVKHLRNLQKIQGVTIGTSECPEYHLGFRSCLANVNQYLLLADQLNGRERWTLSQLSSKLCRSRRRGETFSTTDSDLGLCVAAGPAEKEEVRADGRQQERSQTPQLQTAHGVSALPGKDVYELRDAKQIDGFAQKDHGGTTRTTEAHSISRNKPDFDGRGFEAGKTELHVWRPW